MQWHNIIELNVSSKSFKFIKKLEVIEKYNRSEYSSFTKLCIVMLPIKYNIFGNFCLERNTIDNFSSDENI